jgi:acyl-CoA thioesterase FadM
MYPFWRFATVYVRAQRRPRLSAGDEGRLALRVGLGDLDIYPELNNGRHLTLMDLGRIDFAIRTGLFALLRPKRWALVVAGASVRYRHPLPAFARFELSTQLGRDETWFYFHQRTEHAGRVCSAALVRTAIRSRSGVVPSAEVLSTLGDTSLPEQVPQWVAAWAVAETLRPWPTSNDHAPGSGGT